MHYVLNILTFYKPFILPSFIINIVIAVINPHILPAIFTKLLLTLFTWYLFNETNAKRKLIFYNNLGISNIKLFSSVYLVDIVLTLVFFILIKEFV